MLIFEIYYHFRVINNKDWYSYITAVELIGGAGRHMRMGTLLSRTSVQSRLNSPVGMSFTEFSYQLFQAYDWLHLYRLYECMFQVCLNINKKYYRNITPISFLDWR